MSLTRNLSFLEPLFVPIREAKQKFQQFVESPTTSPLAQFVGERQKSIQEQTAQLGTREITQLPETSPFRYLPGKLAEQTSRAFVPQNTLETALQFAPLGLIAKPLAKTPIGKLATKEIGKGLEKVAPQVFKGFKDLTTKFLDYAKGKTTLSKQEIADFARRPELKKGEADLLNKFVKDLPEGKLPTQEFADSLRRDLLELKPVKVKEPQYDRTTIDQGIIDSVKIPIRKKNEMLGMNYEEVVFESPITTNGSSHYPNSKNYFAHARGDEVVEGGKKIWREQEIQSDLLQKDNLAYLAEKERRGVEQQTRNISRDELLSPRQKAIMQMQGEKEITGKLQQLEPFTNDRFGERIMRERIKEKASKGYEKYRLPTGETIGRIEGLDRPNFYRGESYYQRTFDNYNQALKVEDLKVGEIVRHGVGRESQPFITTKVLKDGKFEAIPMSIFERFSNIPKSEIEQFIKNCL